MKQFQFKIGDKVKSSGNGTFIAGISGEVVSVEKNGEFARYGVKWSGMKRVSFEREQDIVK